MTQEDKQLLLKDLCARLPYKTIVNVYNGKYREDVKLSPHHFEDFESRDIKPYLRPLSSMTEEEQKEFVQFHCVTLCPIIIDEMLTLNNESDMFDWLNAHHFDYRGLISMGLAIDCTDINIY